METSTTTIPDVKEALNEYFKLKLKYETQNMSNKKKIINNTTLSNREKRSEYLKLKPKCINCKRPGGTRFTIHFFAETDKDEAYKEYSATCGIIADPCNLNIKIQIGKTELLPDILNSLQNQITDLKNQIINDKNKLLFGFITTEEALESFDKVKEDINFLSSYYEVYLENYNAIVDNDNKKNELNEMITNSYIQINSIKECVKRMNETNNTQFAIDAINIYHNTLQPLLDNIRALKYDEFMVWHDEDNNACKLIQTKHSIENLSYSSFQSKVASYNFGGEVMSNKKPKFIISDDLTTSSEEVPVEVNEKPTGNIGIPRDEPIYGKGKDGILWNLSQYNELWDKLPSKLKNVLRQDKEWMVEFMFSCVNAKAKREACVFTSPPDLIIPPNELPNGQYDFGVEIYNQEFNKLSKTLQATYLSQFSTKDGIKNYNMLRNSMNELVAKAVDFNRGFF